MANRLAITWTQGIPEDRKASTESAIRNSTIALGRLQEILAEKLEATASKEASLDAYESPSWSHRQAHLNGYRQGLTELLQLLSFLDKGD